MLTVEHVTKQFQETLALNDVSFSMENGIYGLLGPNGSGKTTLMRVLTGVLAPDGGRVRYDGIDIRSLDGQYRDLLGYLPQQFAMYEDFTGEKFLRYVCDLKGIPRADARERIAESLPIVGMAGEEKKKIRKLSGGMRRRIGIAQALLNHPKILVLDEPTSGLDPSERIRLRNYLLNLSKNRIILLSTHIVADLESTAHHLLLLKKGVLTAHGAPAELLQKPNGQVFTLFCKDEELMQIQQQYVVSAISSEEGGNRVRILADNPPPGARQTPPSLEDLYLYYYGETQDA